MKSMKIVAGMTLLSTVLLSGGQAFADEGNLPAEYDTNAQVKFVEDNSQTPPTDPDDPGHEVDPVDPTDPDNPVKPGTSGPLSLDYASSLDFGEQSVSVKDQTYFAKPQYFRGEDGKADTSKPSPNYAQVTDKRGGEKGWSLSVKQNGQFKSSKANKELTGAEISFKNGGVKSSSTSKAPSKVTKEFALSPDGKGNSQTVVAAGEGEGFGTWFYQFGEKDTADKSVELSVPGSTAKEADTYKTTLTWTLTDTPANQ